MATPHGLVVPNIKKVQSLSILEVSLIQLLILLVVQSSFVLSNKCVFLSCTSPCYLSKEELQIESDANALCLSCPLITY